MTALFDWVKKMLADDSGNPSCLRIMGMAIVFILLIPWAYCIFKKGEWIPLDAWTSGTIGTVLASKAWQKISGEPNANGGNP